MPHPNTTPPERREEAASDLHERNAQDGGASPGVRGGGEVWDATFEKDYLGTRVVVLEEFPDSGIALCQWSDGRLWVHWLPQLIDPPLVEPDRPSTWRRIKAAAQSFGRWFLNNRSGKPDPMYPKRVKPLRCHKVLKRHLG